jgi:RNA polymerase sigma-70 factor (ECF subfamily)
LDGNQRRDGHPEPEAAPVRTGTRERFEALVRDHLPSVARIAQRFGFSVQEAEDVSQEVFVRVWRGLPGFRGDSDVRSWIVRIAVRECSRFQARRTAVSRQLPRDCAAEALDGRSVESQASHEESRIHLRAALSAMARKHREVLVLHYLEEMPCEDIARILDCSVGTVHSRLHHARMRLKKLMGKA